MLFYLYNFWKLKKLKKEVRNDGSKQNSDVNTAKNLLFRSSKKLLSSIYISKGKILDELVKLFIKRYKKQVYSCPAILANPYFSVRMKPPQ